MNRFPHPAAGNGPDAPSEKDQFFIVGIGASAGGVQALQAFFNSTPPSSGMAFVVILHLSPDYDSKLTEVLRRVTSMPVEQVNKKTRIRPNQVYVVPPNRHLTMSDGYIIVSPNTEEGDRRAPIDIFFRTLAASHGARAISVILSGTGANGSMGLKRVKEVGGAAFVQNPREAEFNEMPRNAIATEMVDEVLPVAEIPEKILLYRKNLGTIQIPVEAEKRAEDQQHALREIFTLLRLRTGHDFSNYKRPTLLRRIERRINIRNLPHLPAYAAYLQQNPDEITALLKDLLISVTNFFRDKKAFDVIEKEILPSFIEGKKAEEQVRIWVAGCATGEEAYSLAMLCAEKTLSVIDAPKIQIFATDIDEAAITFAREGLYTINDAADVSPERLRRFFNKESDGYRVRREIREMILFANHNFIKDPPFSHLDMISCRNVLIYLNQTARERVMETFHFALRPGGYLFLGLSESADSASDLYAPYNREYHIFQTRQATARTYPVPESVPSFNYTQPPIVANNIIQEQRVKDRITLGDLHQRMLEQYAPPSVVINADYDIVHLSERAGRYLQITGGEPSQNLLKLVRPELRLELRSALYQAVNRQSRVEARGLRVNVDDHTETINIHVRPVFRKDDTGQGFMLVVFEPTLTEDASNEVVLSSDEPVARQLEEELMRLKAQLRASIEQHEFQAEELKASNEELQAMNEELRSAAEELETSKEELQSINEELRTVNQELKVKVEETTLASNNLQNLINSVDIGTIFLDRSFRVALFTPPARNLFNLILNDIGRPLSDITNKFDHADIISDAEVVLEKLHVVEHEVTASDGRLFMMRILPYRTEEDRINGVVITFFDITERKKAEEELRESEHRQAFLLKLSDILQGLATAGEIRKAVSRLAGEHLKVNRAVYAEVEGSGIVIRGEYAKDVPPLPARMDVSGLAAPFRDICERGETLVINDAAGDARMGTGERDACAAMEVSAVLSAQLVKGGRWVASLTLHSKTPRTWTKTEQDLLQEVAERSWVAMERVRAAECLRQSEQQLRDLLRLRDEFIGVASHELKTPLTAIKAYAEIVQEQMEISSAAKSGELLEQLNKQIDRLTSLVNNLLDTTNISEGKLVLSPQRFNLNELLDEYVLEMQPAASQKIVLQAGKLKPVVADKERIRQVINNFVSNAIKYSKKGSSITISTKNVREGVQVSVADQGIGIPKTDLNKIFEKFYRVTGSKRDTYPGMGLGLYISTEIIRRHHGTISVDSTMGKGSTFSFILPDKENTVL